MALGGAFTLYLTPTQAAASQEVVLFRMADSFDLNQVTVQGPNGAALPEGGELRLTDGKVIWMPAAASIKVEVGDDVPVRVSRAWLASRSIDAAHLEADSKLGGANSLPVAVSYALGLEPTNACDNLACDIGHTAEGKLCLRLPNLLDRGVVMPLTVRYIIQYKESLTAEWTDYSTNDSAVVEFEHVDVPSAFFRYRLDFAR